MRKLIRVTISACLALTMVMSLLPMSVIAAEGDEFQAALSENQQILSLPIVNEGDDACSGARSASICARSLSNRFLHKKRL